MAKITMLKNPDIHKVDLVPKGAQQLSKIEIMKGDNTSMDFEKLSDEELDEIQNLMNQLKEKLGIKDKEEEKEEVKEETKEETKEEVKETEEEKCDAMKEGCEPEKAAECGEQSEELKNALAKSANLESENSKLKEQINKMNDENKTKEFLAKASELKNIPGVSDNDLGKILKSISETDSKNYEAIYNILKSANDAIGSGSMFKEIGSNQQGNSAEPQSADEAYAILEKMASERVAKGQSNISNCMSQVLDTPEGARMYNLYKSLKGGN